MTFAGIITGFVISMIAAAVLAWNEFKQQRDVTRVHVRLEKVEAELNRLRESR